MESDLPLMELAEEDDCLIKSFPDPNQTPSKSSFNYFTCSPLALQPTRTKSLKDSVHTGKPSSSSSEASNNKENINSNNVEMPKLGMGPIQMKRRKKGAEYNLRKSLAWDRAFFTDEGILDPRELNLITGVNAYTCGRGLPSISEEGNGSFSSGNDKEASKEALLEELRDKSRTPKGNRVGVYESLSQHKVTHKVLSTDCSNRAGSKVGMCSEPSPASSLKRPNSNTLRTAKKESKLPKLPLPKPGSCLKGSSTARHNLIPKPPINAQKNVGLKPSLKDVHGSQGKPKTGLENPRLPAKELSQKTVRILTHSSSKETSATKSQFVPADKASSSLEKLPDRLQSCEIQDECTALAAKNLAQLTPTTSVNNNSLPSGLRLPSPSLRFFDTTTTSESGSLQKKRIQQYSVNMGSNRQNGELRPPETPRTPNGICSVSNSLSTPCGSTQSSPSSNYMCNKGVPNSNVNPDIVSKMQYECRGSDVESHKVIAQEKRIPRHEVKMGMEKIALYGDETRDEFVLLNEEEKLQNHTATSVSKSGQFVQHQGQNILTMVEGSNSMNFMQDHAQTSEGLTVNCNMLNTSPTVQTHSQFQCENMTLEGYGTISNFSKTHEEEKATLLGAFVNSRDSLSSEKIANLDKPSNSLDSAIIVQEQSISHGCELHNSKASSQILPMVQEDQPNEPQDFVEVMPSMEMYNFEKSKDATVSMKKLNSIKSQDKSLATIETAGEDLAETSRGQTTENFDAPKSLLDAEDWVKSLLPQRGKIGKREDDVGATTSCISASLNSRFPAERLSVNCIIPSVRSSLEESQCAVVTEINDYLFQEKNGSNNSSAMLMEVPGQKQHGGVDVVKTNLSQLRIKIELMNEVAQCASTYPQSLEEERLDIAGATIEAKSKIDKENQKHPEMGILIGNLSHKSDLYECGAKPSNPIILEQSISHGCDLQGNVSGFKGDDQPHEPQNLAEVMTSMKTNEYFTNGQSRYNSSFPVPTTDVKTINTKISVGEQVEAHVLHEGKNKDATVLMKKSNNIKRQDKSLVMHAVPICDEWVAAIDATGEDLAQTSREQADTKQLNTNPESLEVFVESQRGEIGKREDNVGATSPQFQSEGHSGNFIKPDESFGEEVKAEVPEEGKNKGATVSMKRSNNIKRQNKSLVIQAVPFSDEWLAAIEAAGEEILTMKCGAVQHSPPDKSIPERNPWSPVKNKANQIGPYDCTKYTNGMPTNPHLSD